MGTPQLCADDTQAIRLAASLDVSKEDHHVPADDVGLAEETEEAPPPYTVFTKNEKRGIVFLVGLAGFFSPFSAFIYFPALDAIAQSLSVSLELINITITMYLVVQGIVPSLFGDLSDTLGRRPIYILAFLIYFAASLGLALQHSYPALVILRMLQSAGSSATIALAYGVIGDIAPPHERGGYVGAAHVGFNSAPSLGPVIGGVLTERAGWRWIFFFLVILSGITLVLLGVSLPETARKIVGNGSVPPTGINCSPLYLMRTHRSRISKRPDTSEKARFQFPNPAKSFRIIFHKDTALILASNAIFYMKYSCVQASLSPLLTKIYGLNTLQVGLTYLAFGSACAVASYGVGMISDHDYRQTAKAHNLKIDKVSGDEMLTFPIEKARLRSVWYYIFISAGATLGYGWAIQRHAPLAVPLVLQFFIGLTVTGVFNVCNTLVVDLHPSAPATASAAVSMTRCSAAAIGLSVQQLLFDSIGPGWTFTGIAALCYLTAPLLLAERCWGWDWRRQKAQMAAAAAAAREEDAVASSSRTDTALRTP